MEKIKTSEEAPNTLIRVPCFGQRKVIYLLPKHSMISVVRVDLFLSSKASEAAFLNKVDPAMQPNIVGFFGLFQCII